MRLHPNVQHALKNEKKKNFKEKVKPIKSMRLSLIKNKNFFFFQKHKEGVQEH